MARRRWRYYLALSGFEKKSRRAPAAETELAEARL